MMAEDEALWTYRDAVQAALREELRSDERVLLLGEDVAAAGGVFKVTDGLLEEFGSDRVRDTPISEQAIVGSAIGAALLGFRPVVEIMFADFVAVCFDQVVNQLAKYEYLTGGQGRVPVTIRLASGAGSGFGAQHSQPVENWFLGHAGLKVCVPSTAANAYALLREAIRDPGPVLVFEDKSLYAVEEARAAPTTPHLGEAGIARTGSDITIVCAQMGLRRSLVAASALAAQSIEAEVIDIGTLRPMDVGAIARSVHRTGRLACIQEGEALGGWCDHVVSVVAQSCFMDLDAAPVVLASPPQPVPYSRMLEEAWMPNAETIVQELVELAKM